MIFFRLYMFRKDTIFRLKCSEKLYTLVCVNPSTTPSLQGCVMIFTNVRDDTVVCVCIFEVLGRINISGHWRP